MEFCGMKREIDRKCLIHARVHANAQSFDRCGDTKYNDQSTTSSHGTTTSSRGSEVCNCRVQRDFFSLSWRD